MNPKERQERDDLCRQDLSLLDVMAAEIATGNPNPGLTERITSGIICNDEAFFQGLGRRAPRPVRWICNCGAPLNGNHDHYSCGPPLPVTEATGEGYDLGGEA